MIPRFRPFIRYKELRALLFQPKEAVHVFEKEFARMFGAIDALAFPYGRSALWAFLKSQCIIDSEIIMPAYTCSVVAHAISISGNKPVFVDINLSDYNMSLESLKNSITCSTRAIITTNTFGYPQNARRLQNIIRNAESNFGHKIWLIQDCCHAFGAESHNQLIGSCGDVAIYAFNISKILTSIFGGVLAFQDQDLAAQVRYWRDTNYAKPSLLKGLKRRIYFLVTFVAFSDIFYSFTHFLWSKTTVLSKYTDKYHLDNRIHLPPDFKEFMMPVEASVGLVQLSRYHRIIRKRRQMSRNYTDRLRENPDLYVSPYNPSATYSHFVVSSFDRDKVHNFFLSKNIELGKMIDYVVPCTTPYKALAHECSFPNSIVASTSLLNLPLHDSCMEQVVKCFDEYLYNELADLHMKILSKSDLSVQLGKCFVVSFYRTLLSKQFGKVFYERSSKDKAIISMITVITDYDGFYRQYYLEQIRLRLFLSLFNLKVYPLIFKSLFERCPVAIRLDQKVHLGILMVNKNYGHEALRALAKCYDRAIAYCESSGFSNIWGCTSTSNLRTQTFLARRGFQKISSQSKARIYYLLKL